MNGSILLPGEDDTLRLGRELARLVAPGESLFLEGELGAGKSTLARAFVKECGWTGPVRSPSYALVHTYRTAAGTVHHLDLYRLGSLEEAVGLDLDALFSPDARVLVEWPDRLRGMRRPDWHVGLRMEGDGRVASVRTPEREGLEAILAPPPKENAT